MLFDDVQLLADINFYLESIKCLPLRSLQLEQGKQDGSIRITEKNSAEEGVRILYDYRSSFPNITVHNCHQSRGEPIKVFKGRDYATEKKLNLSDSLYLQEKKINLLFGTSNILGLSVSKWKDEPHPVLTVEYKNGNDDICKQFFFNKNKKIFAKNTNKVGGLQLPIQGTDLSLSPIYCEGIATALTLWLALKRKQTVISCSDNKCLQKVVANEENPIVCPDMDFYDENKNLLTTNTTTINFLRSISNDTKILLMNSLTKEMLMNNKGFDCNDYYAITNKMPTFTTYSTSEATTELEKIIGTSFAIKTTKTIMEGKTTISSEFNDNRNTLIKELDAYGISLNQEEEESALKWFCVSKQLVRAYYVNMHKRQIVFWIKNLGIELDMNDKTLKAKTVFMDINCKPISLETFLIGRINKSVEYPIIFAPSQESANFYNIDLNKTGAFINTYKEEYRPIYKKELSNSEHGKNYLKLIKGMCNDDEYRWVIGWHINIVKGLIEGTYKRNQTILCINTRHGSIGKSTIAEVLCDIVGKKDFLSAMIKDVEKITGKFNASLEKYIFVAFEEVELDTPSKMRSIKSILTARATDIEKKGKDSYQAPIIASFYLSTNEDHVLHITGDNIRRYTSIVPHFSEVTLQLQRKLAIDFNVAYSNNPTEVIWGIIATLMEEAKNYTETELNSIRRVGLNNEAIKTQMQFSDPLLSAIEDVKDALQNNSNGVKFIEITTLRRWLIKRNLQIKSDVYLSMKLKQAGLINSRIRCEPIYKTVSATLLYIARFNAL